MTTVTTTENGGNIAERKTTAIRSATLANLLINKGENVLGIKKDKKDPSRLVFIFPANEEVLGTADVYIREKGEENQRRRELRAQRAQAATEVEPASEASAE